MPPPPPRSWTPPPLFWIALLVAALLPRLWHLEALGPGTDEGFSIRTTRVMADGRFSYRAWNDYGVDAYAAKLQPVAEAIAVPFVLVLGDRPLAFRLPWVLASLLLLVLLVRHVGLRHGRSAALVLAALCVLDPRGVSYAQTHRYVAASELFAFLAYLAAERAQRLRTPAAWLAAIGTAILLLHTHLMSAWVLLGLFAAAALPPRRTSAMLVLGACLAYAGAMMLLFREASGYAVGAAPAGEPLADALRRSALSTVRMALGLGVVAAPLAVLGAVGLLRRRTFADAAPALVLLLALLLWTPAGLVADLRPRYGACLQPFAFVAAAFAGGAILVRFLARPVLAHALLAAILVGSAAPTAAYLVTGGTRSMEAEALDLLRRHARPGDAVLYDVPDEDPFGRRPADLVTIPREVARGDGAEARLRERGLVWLIRSSLEARPVPATPEFQARLEEVGRVVREGPFQPPARWTVYRVRW